MLHSTAAKGEAIGDRPTCYPLLGTGERPAYHPTPQECRATVCTASTPAPQAAVAGLPGLARFFGDFSALQRRSRAATWGWPAALQTPICARLAARPWASLPTLSCCLVAWK